MESKLVKLPTKVSLNFSNFSEVKQGEQMCELKVAQIFKCYPKVSRCSFYFKTTVLKTAQKVTVYFATSIRKCVVKKMPNLVTLARVKFNEEIAVRKKENKFLANVQLLRVIEEKTKNNSHPFSFTMYASVGKLMSFRKQF